MGIVFLTGAALLGIGLVRRISPLRALLNHVEQTMWGVVIGWITTTIAAYLLARAMGSLTFGSLLILTAVIWIVALFFWLPFIKSLPRSNTFRSLWRAEYGWLALTLVLFAPFYFRLFSSHMLEPGAEGVYTGGSTYFDIGFHLALTTSFLFGQNFPPLYTPSPPSPLLYPFLPDFQVSVLVALGMSLRAALLTTAIPLALTITGLFYSFAKRMLTFVTEASRTAISTAPVAAALATILFLLNGGLGFIYFIGDWRESGKPLSVFWSQLDKNYANLGGRNTQWTNFIADMLLPQRTSLFGFAAALIVLTIFITVWRNWSLDVHKRNHRSGVGLLLVAGTLTGLLPQFHTHVYMGLGLISGFLFLLSPRRQWLAFWAPAVLLALPHLIEVLGHVSGNSFMRWQPGWRGHNERFWFWYWLRNIGLPTLLIIPAWFVVPALWRKFYLAFVLLLLFSLLVIVTPNSYDNIKLIYLWYVPTSVLVAGWLMRLAVIHRQRLLATILTLICIVSGLLALQSEAVSRQLLYNYEEMAAAAFAREQTSPHSLFLTSPTVHQPILSLAGRPVVRGDTAWLWSHGYEYANREADVKSIYAGSDEARSLIDYYGIDYIYFGPAERAAGGNREFFEEKFPRVYHSPNIAIYHVGGKDPGTQPPATLAPREFASRVEKDPYQFLVEFPRVSYAVYRLYKTALGRVPRYAEFADDLKVVGRELFVGREGWERVLENNKNALADAWQARTDFKTLYDGKSNANYVDALSSNAGTSLDTETRTNLITALDSQTKSRALVLRLIADSGGFNRNDYNTAFVLVHYFGYLRRNPDDAPDYNLAGFNFWLNDLNRTGDYRSMSRVFIEAGEYKDRSRSRNKKYIYHLSFQISHLSLFLRRV